MHAPISLGIVLYEMATGKQAFTGTTSAAMFDAILNRAPAPLLQFNPATPAGMVDMINRLLEKDPDLRYQTAADLRADLKRLFRNTTSGATAARTAAQAVPIPAPAKPAGTRSWIAVGGLLAVVALAAIFGWAHFAGREKAAAPVATNPNAAAPVAPNIQAPPAPAETAAKSPPAPPLASEQRVLPPKTPEALTKNYARDLQASISANVKSTVAEQLRQSAQSLSPNAPVMPAGQTAPADTTKQAAQRGKPCAQITNACKAAGFANGAFKSGNGLGSDCIAPLIDGTPQPKNATIPLPKIDPEIITACKAINPSYGHFEKKKASSGAASGNDSPDTPPTPQ
jgi:hypothetical protein